MWTLEAPRCASKDDSHRPTPGERLLQGLRVSCGSCVCCAECPVQDPPQRLPPCIDTSLTGIKEARQDLVERGDFTRQEQKQSGIFLRSKTRLPSAARASLAGFLGDLLVIPVGIVRHGKVGQEFCTLCLIEACRGTERTRVVFEVLIRAHGS